MVDIIYCVGHQVSPCEVCGAKWKSLQAGCAVFWDGLDFCVKECGSCDLIKGCLRIKAIRKAFFEVLQLFHPPTSTPTTPEHLSLCTPT